MAAVPEDLAAALQSRLRLRRAVETGTHVGGGAEKLAEIFPEVVSIEIDEGFHAEAAKRLGGRSEIELVLGDSLEVLPGLVDPAVPTFYWLDGHWQPTDMTSSAEGGGSDVGALECPVVAEIGLLSKGHPDDCILVDDARIFAVAPAPPYDREQWPSLLEIVDALRTSRPEHHLTIAGDYFIAVPERAREVLDEVARGWMTHQGWRTTDVPMELTDEGWVVDHSYQAKIDELVHERVSAELYKRTLRARVGKALGRG